MLVEERRSRLLEMVRLRGFASLPELAQAMEVSESTIRRDLDQLEELGTARRTHGGVFYTGPSPKLAHFDQKQALDWNKKRAIARRAAELIDDGDTILLDGGSTTYELALLLVSRPLQIVTNSLPVANLFSSSLNGDLVFIGGYIHPRTGVALGPFAMNTLANLRVRQAVLSVAGINEQGCFNSNLLLVETERAMMQAADEVVVVADSTKFGKASLAKMCDLSDVHKLVVDEHIGEDWRSRIIAAGVELVLAGPTDNG